MLYTNDVFLWCYLCTNHFLCNVEILRIYTFTTVTLICTNTDRMHSLLLFSMYRPNHTSLIIRFNFPDYYEFLLSLLHLTLYCTKQQSFPMIIIIGIMRTCEINIIIIFICKLHKKKKQCVDINVWTILFINDKSTLKTIKFEV